MRYSFPILGVCCLLWPGPAPASAELLPTIAERSDYRATSTHAEVQAFCRELAKRSPRCLLDEFGITTEGRRLPLLVLADPPVSTPAEAARSGKLVVLVLGNIHAGEVDGKEALLALARDLGLGDRDPLLKDVVLLVAPIFNADGNDRMSRTHRREQKGPVDGVGIRENGRGLDLNRDFVKLESLEVRALVRLLSRWDPAVVIDTHTTNGSFHRYALTYDGPRHPAASDGLIALVRDRLLTEASKRLKEAGYDSFVYGNFSPDRQRWDSYPAWPRYGVQYVALRNRIGILSESYSYAPYRDRVRASYGFVRGCLEAIVGQREAVRRQLALADRPRELIALRTKPAAFGEPQTVWGFVEEGRVATDQPRDYRLAVMTGNEVIRSTARPFAYLFPPVFPRALENLRSHGIRLEELAEERTLDVEVCRVDKVRRAGRPFQGHRLVTIEVTARPEKMSLPAGAIVVRTEQPLGTLAAFLLEPESEDGLVTWNFFDEVLSEGQDYPVRRLRSPVDLPLKR